MKRISIDGIGYYLSCMMLFNAIYLIKLLEDGLFDVQHVNWKSWQFIVDFSTFCFTDIMFILSIIFTVLIVHRDDSIRSESTLGKEVHVCTLEDLTGENYFANFSLLVLTGLALPVLHHIYSLALYLFVFVALGIVYVKKGLIYMNPFLTMLNFSTYRCKNAKTEQSYIFVVRGYEIHENDTICFQNTKRKIIRLSKGHSSKEGPGHDTRNKKAN